MAKEDHRLPPYLPYLLPSLPLAGLFKEALTMPLGIGIYFLKYPFSWD